jgi:hypothetical protein
MKSVSPLITFRARTTTRLMAWPKQTRRKRNDGASEVQRYLISNASRAYTEQAQTGQPSNVFHTAVLLSVNVY